MYNHSNNKSWRKNEKKEDTVTTEAVETKSSIDETTEAKKDNTKETSLTLGQIDGEVYTNKIFNIKFDAGANQMTLLTDSELGQMGNIKSGDRIVNIVYVTTDANLAKTVMDMFTKAE